MLRGRKREVFIFIQLFFILFFTNKSIAQQPQYVPGEVIVKLRNINAKFSQKLKSGVLKTEISSLDKLNEKFKVSEMERVFKGVKEPQTFSYSKQKASYVSVPDLFPIFKVTFSKDVDVMQAVNAYKSDPNVQWAEPNYIVYSQGLTPNDEYFKNQWYLNNTGQMINPWPAATPNNGVYADIDAPEAWEIQTGNMEVLVAVVDTGIDYNHPDLAGNIWTNPNEIPNNWIDDDGNGVVDDILGYDFCYDTNNPNDVVGHGTHVAGIIAATTNTNGKGVAGMNYKNTTKIMPIRALGVQGYPCDSPGYLWTPPGKPTGTVTTTTAGIVYAANMGAKAINNSWGIRQPYPDPKGNDCINHPTPYTWSDVGNLSKEAIDYADSKGAVIIFAAGNESCELADMPQAYGKVISVAATDHNDKKASYSSYGTWVGISAPGGDCNNNTPGILSTLPTSFNVVTCSGSGNTYGYFQGTSMAAPVVSGVAALIFSQHPEWPPSQAAALVKQKLLSSVDPIDNLNTNTCCDPLGNCKSCTGLLGKGRLNAYKALLDLPSAPANLTASPGNTQITLSWSAATQGTYTISGYNVYRATTSSFGQYTSANKINSSVVTGTTYTDTGLTNGTTYYYVVTAVDSNNNESGYLNEAFAAPAAAPSPPSAPAGVAATAGDSQVSISWNAVSGATSYNLYLASQSGITKSNYATLTDGAKQTGVTSPYIKTGLTNGKTYYFIVTAVNANGESVESTEVSATPTLAIPAAPSGVTAVAGDGQVIISWNTVGGATSYNLYMASQTGVTKSNYSTLTDGMKQIAVTTPYTHIGLTNDKTYYFVVTAVNSSGESAESTQVFATPSVTPPSAPAGVTATAANGRVTLTWNSVTGATSYNLYMASQSGVTKTNYASLTDGAKLTGVTSPYAKTGLTNGKTYYFVIVAVNAGGESTESTQASATPYAPPNAPIGLTATAKSTPQATLSWTAATQGTYAISSYNVYRSATSGSGYAKINTTAVTATTYTDTTVSNNTTYYYVARAIDAQNNESGNSNEATANIPPAVATLATPTAGDGQVTLTWSSVTGATSYNLYMASQTGVTKTNYASLTDGMKHTGVTSPYPHTGLTNGKTYYFVVAAVSASGESDESSEVSTTIPPSTVTGVTAAAGSGQITVSWNAATGATSYNLYMASQSGLTKSNYATLVDGNKFTNVTSPKIISNIINGITYYFIVTAVNSGGESADSNVASTTLPITFLKGVSMIALPLSSSSSASSLFGADAEFNFARWDTEKSTYTCAKASSKCNTVSSDMGISPGNGYWLKLKDEKVFDALNGTPVSASQDYTITIYPGWNQIANPFTQKCSWEKVKVQYNGTQKTVPEAVEENLNWLGSYAWTYRNQTYQCANYISSNHTTSCAQTVLEPFYGYWVYSGISQGTQATLIFSKDCLTMPPAKPVAEKALAGPVFSVQIKASTETSSDENNVFGVSKTKMDEDALKPPDALGQTLRAYFVSGNKQITYDFHGGASQKEQVWDYAVECEGTQNVTLSWDVNALPSNSKLFIQDTATGSVTDMSAQKSVSVSVSGQKAFKIKYYKPDVLSQNNGSSSLFVTKPFMYPNPDKTGNATFRYLTSPEVVRVKIEVYNIAGKLIETFEGNLNGETKWLFGDRVAAGVYLYRITAYTADGKESVIGKMVVVR